MVATKNSHLFGSENCRVFCDVPGRKSEGIAVPLQWQCGWWQDGCTCIAAVVALGNCCPHFRIHFLHPLYTLPFSVLQRQYINPLRRNIECQSTSAFHLGLNLSWKFPLPRFFQHHPTCNSTLNTFIANHFFLFTHIFSSFFLCEVWRMFWQGFVHTFVRSTHVLQCVWVSWGGRIGLKRTRHVFVTYYIFIATNEPLNAWTDCRIGC